VLAEPIERQVGRVLLIDRAGRLLLFRARMAGRDFWITPGGGLNPGETHEEGALRELWEETAYKATRLGPCVWRRSHTFTFQGAWYTQHERFFLVPLVRAVDISYEHWEEIERDVMVEHRWWTAEEICASREVFAPRDLGRLLHDLIRDGAPREPIDVGI
jgi:8-oxo-dGTP pyrophosphatase MutT (NUDIX family)